MNKPLFLFFALALLFSGCYKVNKDVVKKPKNLIPKEKMADLITEMEIIEGASYYNRTHFPGHQDLKKESYKILFRRFHVTRDQVKASMNYYNSRGKEMASIYDLVQEQLAEKQNKLHLKKEKKKTLPETVSGLQFPFLYKEGFLSKQCINPIP